MAVFCSLYLAVLKEMSCFAFRKMKAQNDCAGGFFNAAQNVNDTLVLGIRHRSC